MQPVWVCVDRQPHSIVNCIINPALVWHADAKTLWPIHREAPAFVDQGTGQEILATGIKVRRHT